MKKIFSILMVVMIVVSVLSVNLTVSAASNPYGQWQTISGVRTIRCTYYAWQQAYDNTGVALPNFGNAINWYNGAKNAGYSTGTTAKAKSIAVWSTASGYGHVGYVVSVSGNKMTVNEAGLTNSSGTAALNGNGVNNGGVYNNVVGQPKYSGSSTILVGFIYLTESVGSSSSVTIKNTPDKNTITNTNAILWGRASKPKSYSVTKIGIRVRKDGSTYENGWSKFETPSSDHTKVDYVEPYYNMNTELNVTLTHATKYYYQIYAKINDKEYWSSETSFTTTGSHSYGAWKTTTAATCTATGTQTRSCSCGKAESKTINALGHSYSSSWTIDKAATCTSAGSKSYHCTRCSAKSSVTEISATGHSWGSWQIVEKAACTKNGKQERICSECNKIETNIISATGHEYSDFVIDEAATCTKAGTKSKHCLKCKAKLNVTTIDATGHSWGEFVVIRESTYEQEGLSKRTCINNCGTEETKTLSKLSTDGHIHSFDDWEITKAATCIENGIRERKCTICNEAESSSISMLGHEFGEWSLVDENGNIYRECSLCDEKENQRIEIENTDDESQKIEKVDPEEIVEGTISADENISEPKKDKNNKMVYIIIALTAILVVVMATAAVIIIKLRKK